MSDFKHFAVSHPSSKDVHLLVEKNRYTKDGSIFGYVLNGLWDAYFTETEFKYKLPGSKEMQTSPCKIVWRGTLPNNILSYQEMIEWVKKQIESEEKHIDENKSNEESIEGSTEESKEELKDESKIDYFEITKLVCGNR
jgi:chromatin segregation and condensation protein Rec8/ScpA/Scc1 (kleisin family)